MTASHGSAATSVRCGGIRSNWFVANLFLNSSVKEFWKSINISRSYAQKNFGVFFMPHSVHGSEVNVSVKISQSLYSILIMKFLSFSCIVLPWVCLSVCLSARITRSRMAEDHQFLCTLSSKDWRCHQQREYCCISFGVILLFVTLWQKVWEAWKPRSFKNGGLEPSIPINRSLRLCSLRCEMYFEVFFINFIIFIQFHG